MKITKILNNNVVISKINNEERIVMGKGIAFGKQNGQELEKDKIDKVFSLTSEEQERMLTLLNEIDQLYEKPMSESIYLSLTDHIDYAIKRTREGHIIKNPLLYEINRLYPKEYDLSINAVETINRRFDIQLPKGEAGFIAMHIVNASMDENIANIYEITKITKSILDIVRYHFNLHINEDALSYSRFMTHLKFFSQRLINHEALNEVTDESLLQVLQQKHVKSDACVDKISELRSIRLGLANRSNRTQNRLK